MKIWSKIGAAALGLLVAAPAFATQSRINAMSGGEKSYTVRDEANIHAGLPQFLVDHGNEVDVDAASGGVYGRMNVRYKLTDDAVLLLYGLRQQWAPVVAIGTLGGGPLGGGGPKTPGGIAGEGGAISAPDPTFHQFGIGFGTKLGETLRLGVDLSLGGARADGDGNNLNSNTLFHLGLGLGFDIGETNSLDFGLRIRIGTFTDYEAGADRWVSEGNTGISLIGKGEFQVHPIAKIVPYLTIDYVGVGIGHAVRGDETNSGNQAKKGTVSNTRLAIGADLAIAPAEKVTVQPGLGLAMAFSGAEGNSAPNGQITGVEASQQLMPFYGFAAEAQAFDWLSLRVGARQTIIRLDNENKAPAGAPSQESHVTTTANTLTTGFGISLRGWQIDLNVTPTFFNNNIFAISGAPTAGHTVDFAILYDW